VSAEEAGHVLQLQPTFYDGVLQKVFTDKGPSAKLLPPYFMTSIHLHGGSSGGPVFNFDGEVFGVASCSYDGAEDIAFVTPAGALLDISVPEKIGQGESDAQVVTLRDIAARGLIAVR
jgi:S1-C subfamily serine protease